MQTSSTKRLPVRQDNQTAASSAVCAVVKPAHRQLDLAVLVKEDVRGLQVVVDDPVLRAVDVRQARADLAGDGASLLLGQRLRRSSAPQSAGLSSAPARRTSTNTRN